MLIIFDIVNFMNIYDQRIIVVHRKFDDSAVIVYIYRPKMIMVNRKSSDTFISYEFVFCSLNVGCDT